MTMFANIERTCCICGKTVKCNVLASTNAFGSMDLDTRPPQMKRSTMSHWIEKCPKCGYIQTQLEAQYDLDKKIVKSFLSSREYKRCSGLKLPNIISKNFYQMYLLAPKANDKDNCFFALQCCAWACDDSGEKYKELAKQIRIRAIPFLEDVFLTCKDQHQKENISIQLADYYRRSGQFEKVVEVLKNCEPYSQNLLTQIAHFETQKALEKDDACYKVSDVQT